MKRALILDFGGVISRTLFETHDETERALGLPAGPEVAIMDLDGKLIQADALHTNRPFFSGAWSRGPTCS